MRVQIYQDGVPPAAGAPGPPESLARSMLALSACPTVSFFRLSTEVRMRYRSRLGAIPLVLFGLGVLSCSSRSPVSQAKDGTRSAAGDGAAAAVRMRSPGEAGRRDATRPKAGTPASAAASTGPQVAYAVAFGR